jgi:hypothetical protein
MSDGVGKWLASGRVGASSSALAAAMLGSVPADTPPAYPHDSDDFGRCAVLCAFSPKEVQSGLGRLAAVSAHWRRLAERWDELTDLYTRDLKACNKLVRELTDPGGSGFYEVRKDADGRWDRFKVKDFRAAR